VSRYNRERVILETVEGTAMDSETLRAAWEVRIEHYFPHYRVVKVEFKKNKGKENRF
jgi:hypothetical protein